MNLLVSAMSLSWNVDASWIPVTFMGGRNSCTGCAGKSAVRSTGDEKLANPHSCVKQAGS